MSENSENHNEYALKDLFVFDLDGTLAESKAPLTEEMSQALVGLLKKKKVCIISGGNFDQFKIQVIDRISEVTGPQNISILGNLYIQPTSGQQMYTCDYGKWNQIYIIHLSDLEKKQIREALEKAILNNQFTQSDKIFGEQIEDRDSQITFSALGQNSPVDLKKSWDPDMSKKKKLVQDLETLLPDFEVRAGGLTSIDIVKKGMDKAYGINRLSEYLKIPISKICFIGDAIYIGGNDYSATLTGVECIKVKDPKDTLELINGWLK